MLTHQIDVQDDQERGDGGEQQHMHTVEPGKGDYADLAFSTQKAAQIGPDNRRLAGNLRRDHCSPIGAVVPGQQITGQPVGQGQQ